MPITIDDEWGNQVRMSIYRFKVVLWISLFFFPFKRNLS